jgi:5'-nucleotidase
MRISLLSIVFALLFIQTSTTQKPYKYNHILITNDDGIEDVDRLLALAKSVKKVAEKASIVVSAFDRSGTSNQTTFGKYQSTLEVTCRYLDKKNNITIYTIPGNPADCVLLGLSGLFPNDKPDLVLSGINGGANIGPGWFGSGTIGAIRASAFLGVKGIALSGFDDDDKRSFKVVPEWVTKFISSELIKEIDKNSYLTIGFPDVPLEKIKGIKMAQRRVSLDNPNAIRFHKVVGKNPHEPENKTIWSIKSVGEINNKSIKSDDTYLKEGYIIITPMSIDENNITLKNTFQKKTKLISEFSLKTQKKK